MPLERPCPGCSDSKTPGRQTASPGTLEQCGKTHLKTTKWTCNTCGQVDWDPATNSPWHTTEIRDALTGKVLSVPRTIPE